jgi:hypothetical protein
MNIITADQRISPPPPRRPWAIYWPAIGVAVLLALYTAYWFVASGKVREGIENFAATPQDVVASWSELSMGGYPYRISANFEHPKLIAPNTPEAWEWNADALEADLLPYNLQHIVLKVEGAQTLRYRDVSNGNAQHLLKLNAEGSWASYGVEENAPLGRLAIDIKKAIGQLDARENYSAERLQLHLRPVPEETGAPATGTRDYDLALQGEALILDPSRASAALGPNIALFVAQTRARKVPVANRASFVELLKTWRAAEGTLAVSDLTLKWGALDMTARGELHLDEEARFAGRLDAVFTKYEDLLKALVTAGVVTEQQAKIASVGLSFFSQFQGSKQGAVKLPLVMRNGTLFLGPLPIGQLDPLY